MRAYLLLISIPIAIMVASCAPTPTIEPTETLVVTLTVTPEVPEKQPEPDRPLIKGQISGLPADTLVRVYMHTPSGRRKGYFTRPGNGLWEAVVTRASGVDYVVTAEAEGYVSQPISYTIHISGDVAYVVRDGQVTDKDAIYLDFHFVQEHSP